jgi:serine protease
VPPQRADIINLSLGSSGSSQTEQQQISAVRDAGVVVVASAGNDHSTAPFYPAAYQGVVSVAATTIDKRQAPYSNSGATIDVAAPGGYNGTDLNGDGLADGVVSTIGDDSGAGISYAYAALMGTSMAAPHIAGVAALMKALYSALSPNDFDSLLATGTITEDLGAAGRDNVFGHGLIDAQKAVIAALDLANANGAPTGPILTGSPSSLNFGFFEEDFDVVLRNAGSGSLRVVAATTSEPWLTVTPINVDANGLGSYRLSVNRAIAPGDGTFAATARFDSDVPGGLPFTVSVVMQNLQNDPVADAGRHYVIAWHPFTGVPASP